MPKKSAVGCCSFPFSSAQNKEARHNMSSSRSSDADVASSVQEFCVNDICIRASELEAKLDEGNLLEVVSTLKDSLALSTEEARAIVGKIEYQRDKLESVLGVFDGIDFLAAIHQSQPSTVEPTTSRRSRSHSDSLHQIPQHTASLLFEAIYLKTISLQKLGKIAEAAMECRSILDAVEAVFPQGLLDTMVDDRLLSTVSKAVELLPELCKQAESYEDAIDAYRRALLCQWNLDNDCCARIQKKFAIFLLYSGLQANAPSLSVQIDGSFIPKSNMEEALLLLMILLRKFYLGKTGWDPSVIEHFIFAISLCGHMSVLARHIEEAMPAVYSRWTRWYLLALCYSAEGQKDVALDLLRKCANNHEKSVDPQSLLLAAKLCSENCQHASEGVIYARKALNIAHGLDNHFKGVSFHLLGLCLSQQAKTALSDIERSSFQLEALKSLDEAIAFDNHNPDLIFELGVQYAEHGNSHAALRCAKQFVDATGGSILKGWKLLALVLSAQKRHSEAEMVIEAALDETAKWERGPLLKMKAKVQVARSSPMNAVETYRLLLALVQAQKESCVSHNDTLNAHEYKIEEFEVWQDLAALYLSLSQWTDAEICLEKARSFKQYSAAMFHTEGSIYEARGQFQNAFKSYTSALALDTDFVPCKVSVGALLLKMGSKSLPVARSFLSNALRLDPKNHLAWYYLGLVHRNDGRITDACDCFQAAIMLEGSAPIESFGLRI